MKLIYNIVVFLYLSKLKYKDETIKILDYLGLILVQKNLLKSIERIGPHNFDVLCVLFGSLLGDGYAVLRQQIYGQTVRFSFKQSIVHKEYLFYLYNFVWSRGYCSDNEPRLYKRYIKNIDNTYYGYEFNSFSLTSLIWVYNFFYVNGVKVVPSNIEMFMTPLTLAIWISDDGGWTGHGVRIATNNYTLSEIKFLVNILENKFKLNCTIQKISIENKYSIYIKVILLIH